MAKTQFDTIFNRFDGFAHAEDVTTIPQKTWRNWKASGFIPQNRHVLIYARSRACGIDINPSDFSAWIVDAFLAEADSAALRSAANRPQEANSGSTQGN